MESNPDLADNTFEVFRYIIANDLFSDYNIVWLVNNPEQYDEKMFPDRVSFRRIHPVSRKEKIEKYIICNRARIIIDCNRHYPRYKTSRRQLNVYLDHGMPLKDMTKYNHPLDLSCDIAISQSEFFVSYMKQQYGLNGNQIIVAGVPRDDQLYREHNSLFTAFPEYRKFDKIVAWVPTFRKMANGGRLDCNAKQPYGMPVFQNIDDIELVNKTLKETNTLLIIKPHPAQDLSFLNRINSSNIVVLYNDEMLSKGIQTNELLQQTDAMISDYSGIYYDYLILNKPIGLTLDDFDEYKDQKGFVFEKPLDILKGRYIYTVQDFADFINEVKSRIDSSIESRKSVNVIVNKGMGNNSAQRVIEIVQQRSK